MLAFLQKLGKSLMLPVATMPAAAILQGFGLLNYEKDIPLGATIGGFLNQYFAPFLNAGANAIFGNLALIFAVGVAIGFAGDAVAALSAVISYMVLTKILLIVPLQFSFINDDVVLNMGVLGGIFAGAWAAFLYKRYHNIKMPDWLGFFAGKRFVPIITAASMMVLAVFVGMIWSPIQDVISDFGNWVVSLGAVGAFIFGTANRLLIPFGLHHVLNTIAWFQIGDFTNAAGELVHGDLYRFFAGDKTAGMFMTGFFPIMMFALPGAALAFIHTAKPEKRKMVASIFIGSAIASFLTGITEPLEFSFMFVAPLLYGVHALLTGFSMALMYILDVKLGFGFSAGLIDYLVNLKLSTNAWILIPVGLGFFVLYYVLFRFIISLFKLKTPGREDDDEESLLAPPGGNGTPSSSSKAAQILENIGGPSNIRNIDACITRLRLIVNDEKAVKDSALKQLGASGVMRLGQGAVQIVFGPKSEQIKDDIQKLL
ncbi:MULTISPECIES: N-acetylglucosamine-specific PTS transporter subunit IIBC [Paenibacillus]|jgi:PTS system N-acetylglucosamine-specific IIC component|uniref:PTS sugar transporter n=1 Tax=Paenibacillus odorifer TaxID=189426 RepID=A0A1R0WY77_9BACL|nr:MULTISPECIES: N-acetylglucosamine-specific PTS transporter subunit IIBC [Paenibacillus]AIQ74196.1 PTS sugar transporter [Paenibacillus odorifer]ETT48813.1 PTS system, N-acetylglucosamine-specific IIBC subunit [Paenibacillus sp. FSL H8-237]MDH6427078.1 PTS system N-acetylglucosamine-specific IIC component [Paenibacillus sp. PastH-4]MDH6443107.1 PTS system N-acetylglucosamine-specific IIC component [Paenibacillus sp. PastF-4]MDH6526187.1 PTS system N-acetylglucosamine-specific IIC component [